MVMNGETGDHLSAFSILSGRALQKISEGETSEPPAGIEVVDFMVAFPKFPPQKTVEYTHGNYCKDLRFRHSRVDRDLQHGAG
jgi:hypothetical protein